MSRARYILQGATGCGKTTLTNLLVKFARSAENANTRILRDMLETSAEPESKTTKIQSQQTKSYIFEDHPGISDTFSLDEINFDKLVVSVKAEPLCAILFIISPTSARFDMHVIKRIKLLQDAVGRDILHRCVIVTTKFCRPDATSQQHLMEATLREAYKKCCMSLPTDESIYQRVFYLDCDPQETNMTMGGAISEEALKDMYENQSIQCERILRLKSTLPPLQQTTILSSILVPTHPKRAHENISMPPIPKRQQTLALAFSKQQQERPNILQQQEENEFTQFCSMFSIRGQSNGFIGCKPLQNAWKEFRKCNRKLPAKLDIHYLQEHFPNVKIQHTDARTICKKCVKFRDTIYCRKLGVVEFCICLEPEACRKALWIGISSSKIQMD